jgi:excisionase family DNA binding protein
MGYFEGKFVMISSAAEAYWLEVAIAAAIKQWRTDGDHHPRQLPLLLRLQSELHAVATKETPSETSETVRDQRGFGSAVSQDDSRGSLTTHEAAARLKVSVQMVRRYCDTERLTARRDGKFWRIDPRSVEEMEKAQ